MIWLVVLGLGGFVVTLLQRIGDLASRVDGLERRVVDLLSRLQARAPTQDDPAPRPAPSPLPVARSLETPAPPQLVVPIPHSPYVESERDIIPPPRVVEGPPPRERIRAWMEENGLAWAGGGALALGGLFLVTYAAQRGVFTPPFRIAAAVVVGLVLLAASTWLRRRSEHPLAPSLSAGAGAATLYGAAWASYWLYDFIGLGVAGGLLAAISAGLLTQAFRFGEPLAVLAVLGGFLAPAITGPDQWTAPALTAYLLLITATGFLVSAGRRWGLTGWATLAGAAVWAVDGFVAKGFEQVAALSVAPLILACAAVEWRRRKGEAAFDDGPGEIFTLVPAGTLLMAAVLTACLPLNATWARDGNSLIVHAAGAGALVIAVVAALAAQRRLIPPVLVGAGWIPALVFALFNTVGVPAAVRDPWSAGLVIALTVAGVIAVTSSNGRMLRMSAGGAAVAALVLGLCMGGPWVGAAAWVAPTGAAVVLMAAAALIARRGVSATTDLPLAFWIWASGAAALVALQRGTAPQYLPVAMAALSLVAAFAHARLGWRGFAGVMLASATSTLAALLSPALFILLTDAKFDWWAMGLVAAASAGLVFLGAWIASEAKRPRQSAEALSTGAILIAVAGAAVLLRLAAVSSAEGGNLDVFFEASLRTVLLLAAGLASAQAVRPDSTLIGRWRGHVLLLLGAAHGVLFSMIAMNPLWAWWKPAVVGPPLFDSLAVAFLAPAALLGFAAWKRVSAHPRLPAIYALGSSLFGLAWAVMELRRLFQGANLHAGLDSIGRAEAAAYAVLALLVVRLIALAGAKFAPERLDSRINLWAGAAALAFAVLVFGYGASPWWGPVTRPLAGLNATLLLFVLYVAGGSLTFMAVKSAEAAGQPIMARSARASTVVIAFALLNLVVRFAFRGFDMRPNLADASLETWAFSAIWGLFGFGLLIYGAARRSSDLRAAGMVALLMTLAKIFLFDMARLEGVIRAASFLAVGTLLLTAAILARRLSAKRPDDAVAADT